MGLLFHRSLERKERAVFKGKDKWIRTIFWIRIPCGKEPFKFDPGTECFGKKNYLTTDGMKCGFESLSFAGFEFFKFPEFSFPE